MKLTEQYRAAARKDITIPMTEWDRPLLALFPENVMPTTDQFNAVYAVTGKTQRDRADRMGNGRILDATTESAWCRYQLRRWALKEQATQEGAA